MLSQDRLNRTQITRMLRIGTDSLMILLSVTIRQIRVIYILTGLTGLV